MKKHFTVTTFIVNQNKTLLHRHIKTGKLLPPGGHLEDNELPHEGALREVKEETGLEVTLYEEDSLNCSDAIVLPKPRHVLLIEVGEEHYHIDLCYFAHAQEWNINPGPGEANSWIWVSREELSDLPLVDNIKQIAEEALSLLSNN
ncbi:NUDIX hydrolase [Spirochaeta cellobiosiphila]|uniref:NUDIX hydrolase n=1 Tax=Spirochaeta cellobiosiphila TaxID=504483 RepID=UPI0003F6B03A|nr:NUDIX domain-containing protein [Spirochaeta cellobiosiphila]